MDNKLIIGVNTAMFDGWDLDTTFAVIKKSGFKFVELAYNQGYVGNLNAALFEDEHARHVKELLEKHQLGMHALGCTVPLSGEDAIDQFSARIRFAGKLGVKYLNISLGKQEFHDIIVSNLKQPAPLAREHNCIICMENGGDPNYNFMTCAEEVFAALDEIAQDSVGLNVDPGNTLSMRSDIDPIADALTMLPRATHFHVKDVQKRHGEYRFPAIGQGDLDYRQILVQLAERQIPCSLEIPLRMHRKADTFPVRSEDKVSLDLITEVLADSRKYIESVVGYSL